MIYGNKHVVFEQVGVDSDTYKWNSDDNFDDDNCSNNYSESKIRGNLNQNVIEYLSNDLQSKLVATTVQTAKNGNATTLVSTSDKLFLPAGKEISASPSYSISQENSALTTWTYWTTHTSASDRVKYDGTSTARAWWLRSPQNGSISGTIYIDSAGIFIAISSYNSRRVSSCFAW